MTDQIGKPMHFEGFTLIPVDAVPKKDYSNRKLFYEKAVDEWKWQDFLWYFITRYNSALPEKHHRVEGKAWGEYKGKIEPSMALRGNVLLKEMIDWVFDDLGDHPSWRRGLRIDIVCGNGWLAQDLATRAERRLGAKKVEAEIEAKKLRRGAEAQPRL